MPQADLIFKKTFRKHFTNHEANFPPTTPVAIGDFGEMRNGYFVRLGNIKTMGIEYDILPDNDPSHEQFKSEGSVEVSFKAKGDISNGGVPLAKAQVEVKFASEKSFFFSSAEVRYLQIENLYEVGERIISLYEQGVWEKRFVLVSRLLEGMNTIILMSGSAGGNVVIEAETADIPNIDLANASAKLGFKFSSSLSYQIIAPTKLQIGFGLSRIYNPIFNKPVFKVKETLNHTFAKMDHDKAIDRQGLVFGDVLLHDEFTA